MRWRCSRSRRAGSGWNGRSRNRATTIKIAEAVLAGAGPIVDPDDVRRSYRNALRQQLAEIDQNMQGLQRGLVPPERMAKLLEEMLSRSRGLQLVSLRTLPVQRFETPAAAPAGKAGDKMAKPAPKEPERTVYQHSFEITLQGSYFELLRLPRAAREAAVADVLGPHQRATPSNTPGCGSP